MKAGSTYQLHDHVEMKKSHACQTNSGNHPHGDGYSYQVITVVKCPMQDKILKA